MTVSCPLDCEYLLQAREHERPVGIDPEHVPNRDIDVSERILRQNEPLVYFMGKALGQAMMTTRGAVDSDAREALESLIRTYRTLQSGVYYESRPDNPVAGEIYGKAQQALAEFRRRETQESGMTKTRDAHVLATLVYFQRVALNQNNSRPRGRGFLSVLVNLYGAPAAPAGTSESALILP